MSNRDASSRKPHGYRKIVKRSIESQSKLSETIEEFDVESSQLVRRTLRTLKDHSRTTEDESVIPDYPLLEAGPRISSEVPVGVSAAPATLKISIFPDREPGDPELDDFWGDYLVPRVSRGGGVEWEFEFEPLRGLSRLRARLALDETGRHALSVWFEGTRTGPGWKGCVDPMLSSVVVLDRDESRAGEFDAGRWPRSISVVAIRPAAPAPVERSQPVRERHSIPAMPTAAEMAAMRAFVGNSGSNGSGGSGSGGNGGGGPEPPEGCCPDPDQWTWTTIMNTACWYFFETGDEIKTEDEIGFGEILRLNVKKDPAVWELVPTALTDGNNDTDIDTPPKGPAFGQPRGLNTIATKCLFGDFNLKFKFRCPNRRRVWTEGENCGDSLQGIRNWGNSGVYIFDMYEFQILDSYNALESGSTNVGWTGAGLYDSRNTIALFDAGEKTCRLPITQLCGAIYEFRAPDKNMVKQAVGAPPADTAPWNELEIGFMAPRFDQGGAKVRCATITARLNGEVLYTHLGLPSGTGSRRTQSEKIHLVDDTRYRGENWQHSRGHIVLQEHDNHVQFKDITINPAWVPTVNGRPLPDDEFDASWQREYVPQAAELRLKCQAPTPSQ